VTTLFGFSIASAMPIVLGAFVAVIAVLAWLGSHDRRLLKLARRTILHPRTRSTLIVAGWMLSVVILATFVAGCGKGH
jgi:hypothetical protein